MRRVELMDEKDWGEVMKEMSQSTPSDGSDKLANQSLLGVDTNIVERNLSRNVNLPKPKSLSDDGKVYLKKARHQNIDDLESLNSYVVSRSSKSSCGLEEVKFEEPPGKLIYESKSSIGWEKLDPQGPSSFAPAPTHIEMI